MGGGNCDIFEHYKRYLLETYITLETVCENCKGAKQLNSPIWNAFHAEFGRVESSVNFMIFKEQYNIEKMPSRYIKCPKCDGTGRQTDKINLAMLFSLFQSLGGFVKGS